MADLGIQKTEEHLAEVKARIQEVYREARKDLQKKADEHVKRFLERDKQKQAEKQSGKITEQDYKTWVSGQVFIGKQWRSKVWQMTRTLVHAEEEAVQIVREGQMDVFEDNANFMSYSIDKETGFAGNFSLYDPHTVANLIENEPELMPRRVVNEQKCEAWNQKIIANCITQGIIQGESIDKIAERIARDTASTDMKAMTRYARTAMTGAQNAGRLQSMRDSLEQGIMVKKVWLAVMDERTRDAHEDLDGIAVNVNEPFENDLGTIMYPGDPDAEDANVWNCRCALGYEYPDNHRNHEHDDIDYDEWVEMQEEW